jgi:catechol 2,3-dioxygenase-like lactoylglutathione lyase family enzyme
MSAALHTVMIYARDTRRTAEFYCHHFGMQIVQDGEGLIILSSSEGSAQIAIHPAAKGIKLGQVAIKLVFSVKDVEAFKNERAIDGLNFGATHQANGYQFANAKDPDKNSICISSRAFRKELL